MTFKKICDACGKEITSIAGNKDIYGTFSYGMLIDQDDLSTRYDYCKECGKKAAKLLKENLNKND